MFRYAGREYRLLINDSNILESVTNIIYHLKPCNILLSCLLISFNYIQFLDLRNIYIYKSFQIDIIHIPSFIDKQTYFAVVTCVSNGFYMQT